MTSLKQKDFSTDAENMIWRMNVKRETKINFLSKYTYVHKFESLKCFWCRSSCNLAYMNLKLATACQDKTLCSGDKYDVTSHFKEAKLSADDLSMVNNCVLRRNIRITLLKDISNIYTYIYITDSLRIGTSIDS